MAGIKNNQRVEIKNVNGVEYRRCNNCKEWFTIDGFYNKCKNNPNWIDSICKDCRKTKSLIRQIEKRDYINQQNRKKKIQKRGYQSPFNYMGNKYLILKDVVKLFPKNIDVFYDLFCGGCNIGININANKIICNDINSDIINVYNECKKRKSSEILKTIENTIKEYDISSTNRDTFDKLKKDFNSGNKEWSLFYVLVTYSFNQHPLYTKKGDYSAGIGYDLCHFNFILKKRLVEFTDRLKDINIEFINKDFREIKIDNLSKNDFVYCDPPYSISNMEYNEYNGWSNKDNNDLLDILNELNNRNIKFALSNVLGHKGKVNNSLIDWSKNYNTHYIDRDYLRVNNGRKTETQEVLITNY